MIFEMRTTNIEKHCYFWTIEAKSLEEAKQKIMDGEGEMIDSIFIDSEIESVEEEK